MPLIPAVLFRDMDGFQVTRRLLAILRRFQRSTRGAILVETLVVVPVVVIFAVGLVEFGSLFWQRQQLQAGVRDAARYMSRCEETLANCTLDIARNVAFFGTPAPEPTTPLRVRGWSQDDQLEIVLTTVNAAGAAVAEDDATAADRLVTVTGTATYTGSPLFGLLRIANIPFSYSHQERFIGW